MRTLGYVPGLFGKICYLAKLRNEDGEYDHWGFKRSHGAELASESMHTAHRIIFAEVLRSRVTELCSELEIASLEQCLKNQELRTHLIPKGTGRGLQLHFNAVVAAVSALGEAQRQSSHRDA